MRRAILITTLAFLTTGCSLAPAYERPGPAVRATWPTGASYAPEPPPAQPAGLPWRTVFSDPKLVTLINRALLDNRSLRATVAGVVAARAQYRETRSAELPTVSGGAAASEAHSGGVTSRSYSADIGLSSFEIDLFGRLRNLSKAAFESYLATKEGARATRLTLVSEVATAYATLAADIELLKIANSTLASAERSLKLTQSLHAAGLASQVDMAEAETTVASAQSDIQSDTTQVAQDQNALELLVGSAVDAALLPTSLTQVERGVSATPPGLASTVLLQRPDVLEAEHNLKAQYADFGAARAAFFPTISLTSTVGLASTALSSLFTGGAAAWSVAPSASVPIFGGSTRAALSYSKAERDAYLATYQSTVQTAFEEVANALARVGTIKQQQAAQARLVTASQTSYRLADTLYRTGTGTFLDALIAQRTLYAARQTALATQLAGVSNLIALYEDIGADESL